MKDKALSVFALLRGFVSRGHHRSVKAKKNIITSFIIKGASIIIGLVLIPLTVGYVNPIQYGIWLTLSSIVGWFSYFDIGFGNGLRNKFAESIAKKEYNTARVYVSTTYAVISVLAGIVILIFLCINPFINWPRVLNAPSGMAGELGHLALIVFIFFCFQFILQLITTVLTANQEPAKASLFNLLGSIFSLVFIFILTKTTTGNLIYLGAVLAITPVLVLTASSLWFYTHEYKIYAPSFKFIKLGYARNLMGLGINFFVIQIAALILFQTDNIIITQLFSPKEVTTFNIAFRLFSVIIMAFSIIITPLWSAFTEAYTNKDFQWIKTTLLKLKKLCMLLALLTVFVLLMSPLIFKWWMGDKVKIPFSLSIALSLYIIVCMWQNIHVYFLNGIGKIRLQLYLVIISGIINIPIAIILGKWIGLPGITLSNVLVLAIMGIIFSVQVKKIVNNKATGVWAK
ncbi:MAG TPA: oligosaccharide flippase family protein [Chitinophagaceae bacterium]